MSFTEREAIKFEMEELKEQARRDFEIYLTSRNVRNDRYTELMDRLREIDQIHVKKENVPPQPVQGVDNFLKKYEESKVLRDLPKPKWEGTLSDLRIDKVRPNEEIIVKDKPKKSISKKNIKIEQIDPLVEKYLQFRQTEERTSDIQSYVEKELNHHWVNFSVVLARILEVNPRIKKGERQGYYYYDSI